MSLETFASGRRCFWVVSLFAIFCVGVATWVVWRDLGRPLFGIDDADIFFVYARNIMHGHGFVYNVGGEHVDGASSLLYLFLCCLIWPISSHPEVTLLLVNFIFVAIICMLTFGLFQKVESALDLPRGSSIVLYATFLLWVLLNPSFFVWTIVALMDEGLYALLLLVAFVLLARWMLDRLPLGMRQARYLSVLIVLTILARPEGVAWGLLESLCFLVIAFCTGRNRPARSVMVLPFAALAISYLGLLGAHALYFGYPLPNTYYAKVTADRVADLHSGIHYFHTFVRFYGWFVLLPFLLAAAWLCISFARKRALSPMAGFTLLAVAFIALGLTLPILEGGEHFGFRMFQPVYMFLSIAVVLPLLPALRRRRWGLALTGTLAFTLLYVVTTQSTWSQFQRGNSDPTSATTPTSTRLGCVLASHGRTTGRQLHALFSPGLPTIGISAAGGIAYGYNGTVYDMLGLNNTRMAHADRIKTGPKDHGSFDQATFFSLAPDILMPQSAQAGATVDLNAVETHYLDPKSFENQIYKGIFNTGAFQAEYRLALVQSPLHPELVCYGFFRKDYLSQLTKERGFKLLQQM